MNQILQQGKRTFLFIDSATILDHLPKGYYNFELDAKLNASITRINDLYLPEKVYNQDEKIINMIETSFKSSKKNMGVLLSGKSGTGKTVTSKLICQKLNIPVIIINNSIPEGFNLAEFINNIEFECIFLFDEFEKNFDNYKNDESHFLTQESLLSILDGINSVNTKKLFLFTSNSTVNQYLLNRPSRIKFHKEYNAISEDLVKFIVDDKLVNKEFKQDIISNIDRNTCTIDILISIIEEVNLHNIPFSEFKDFFNYKESSEEYNIYELVDDKAKLIGTEVIENNRIKNGYRLSIDFISIDYPLNPKPNKKYKHFYELIEEGKPKRYFYLLPNYSRYTI